MQEEGARYFPGDDEVQILSGAAPAYFALQERSEERQQLVLQVAADLSRINKRWDARKVRLWFHNYHRIPEPITSNSDSEFPVIPPQVYQIRPNSIPPKKRIAAKVPASLLSSPVSRVNSPDTLSQVFHSERMTALTEGELKAKEASQTKNIQDFSDRKWTENIAPEMGWKVCSAPQTLPTSISPYSTLPLVKTSEYGYTHKSFRIPKETPPELAKFFQGPNFFENSEYNLIEVAVADADSMPAIIDYKDGKHTLHYNNRTTDIETIFPPSSMIYDTGSRSLFIGHQNTISQITILDGKLQRSIPVNGPPLRNSCLAMHQNVLICASRNAIHTFMIESETANSVVAPLKSVTSMASVSNELIIASHNHQSILSIDPNGVVINKFLGFEGGITCLRKFDNNCFIGGSTDSTIRLWDIRSSHFPEIQFQRHLGSVTALATDSMIIGSGGEDRKFRAWDARFPISMSLFETDVGRGVPYSISLSVSKGKITIITSESKFSTAEGIGIPKLVAGSQGLGIVSPNQCLSFSIYPQTEDEFL